MNEYSEELEMKQTKKQTEKQTHEYTTSRVAVHQDSSSGEEFVEFHGFSTKKEMRLDSIQRYLENCKMMLASSAGHFRSPVTIIVIILLIATYILLGVAGTISFSFYSNKIVQYITTNLDIIVNAMLGYFFGPVVSAVSVGLCCIVRIITNRTVFFIGYVIGATIAGFLHGWILYRHKNMWFGTRWRGFYTDLLSKVFVTRFVVSAFVNILLMAVIYKLFINYPIYEYLMHYAKSGVVLTSFMQFVKVFAVSLFFETVVIFVALVVINFIAMKAFPSQFEDPSLLIDENGNLINLEDEYNNN